MGNLLLRVSLLSAEYWASSEIFAGTLSRLPLINPNLQILKPDLRILKPDLGFLNLHL